MTQRTVLEIVKRVAGRVGINKPNTATGSTDIQILQLVDLLNEEGQELASRFSWQLLINEKTFTSVNSEDQGLLVGGTILSAANGFEYILNGSIFNRTTRVEMPGSMSIPDWQAYKASGVVSNPYGQYRLRGGHLLLMPAPAAGQTIAFEYKSKNWITKVDTTTADEATADSDVPILDTTLLTMGLVWRWKAAKGLEYAEDHNKYEAMALDQMTRDAPGKTARMDGCDGQGINPTILVSRGSWNL